MILSSQDCLRERDPFSASWHLYRLPLSWNPIWTKMDCAFGDCLAIVYLLQVREENPLKLHCDFFCRNLSWLLKWSSLIQNKVIIISPPFSPQQEHTTWRSCLILSKRRSATKKMLLSMAIKCRRTRIINQAKKLHISKSFGKSFFVQIKMKKSSLSFMVRIEWILKMKKEIDWSFGLQNLKDEIFIVDLKCKLRNWRLRRSNLKPNNVYII